MRPVPRRTIVAALLLLAALGAYAGAPQPVLKWSNAGCFASWCETGWYASPAVADVDGDGSPDVIGSAYSIVSVNGRTGALQWRVASGHDRTETGATNVGRTWPGIVVADIDGDGRLEIVTAHAGGWVAAYDGTGRFRPGWPRQPTTAELRGLLVADLDGDGRREIVVTRAGSGALNTWALESDGTPRSGWPQLSGGVGYAAGVYNDNAAAGDLDGSGTPALVVPSDVHYACAYAPNGTVRAAAATYGTGKTWGEIGFWEDPAIELRGWGACNGVRSESYRANLANSPAAIGDLDGDGRNEIVIAGDMTDCSTSPYTDRYIAPFVLAGDRTRFKTATWDWSKPPADTGAPWSTDYNVIESAQPNPVLADLDGDGRQEILVPSYDGRLHAFWLDRTEHGNWPFAAKRAGDSYMSYATEPAVADLDGDGHAEVIVATWPQKGSGASGRLFILDDLGNVLRQVDLPPALGGGDNGVLAAPTLADIDADGTLDVVLQSRQSGLVAYALPGAGTAHVIWATGRGSAQRSGTCGAARPPAIAGLLVAKSGISDVQLSWTAAVTASRYRVRRAAGARMDGATPVGDTRATTLADPGAQRDGRPISYYQVRGVNGCNGEGP